MTKLAYRTAGAGQTPVVLLHGWCCRGSDWDAVVADLATCRQVIVPDLPGHGISEVGEGPWTVESSADAVAKLLRELEAERVVLVGHSLGAAVAIEVARRSEAPQVSKLLAVESLHHTAVYPRQPDEVVDVVMSLYEADFAGTLRAAVDWLVAPHAPSSVRQAILAEMLDTPPKVAIPLMRSLLAWDRDGALAACAVPVHVIAAQHLLDDAARTVLEGRCTITTVAAGGHFLMHEAPQEITAAIQALV